MSAGACPPRPGRGARSIAARRAAGGKTRQLPITATVALVSVAAVVPYANVFALGFVGDDLPLIVNNPQIKTLSGVLALFGASGGWPQARALRDASYAIDLAIGGGGPAAFHVSNVVYHAIAALLVFAFARRALRSDVASLVAAIVFAVHPVHSEAVASLAGRKDVLVTIFALASLLAFDRFEAHGGKRALAGVVVGFVLGFLVKETIVVLPLLMLGLVLVCREGASDRRRRRRGWILPSVLLLGSVALGLVAVFVFRISALAGSDAWRWHGGSVLRNALTIPRLLARYAELLVAPARLRADYDFDAFPISSSVLELRFVVALLILVTAVVAVAWASRRDRRIAFAAGWVVVALLPVLQIVPHHELFAERYVYLPSVGIALLAGIAAERLLSARPAVLAAEVVVLSGVGSARAWAHNEVFRDVETLSRSVADSEPRCARAQYNLGQCALRDGRQVEARARFQSAVDVGPGSFPGENRVYGPALNEIGLLSLDEWLRGSRLTGDGDYRDAEASFTRAAEAWPGAAAPWLNRSALERTAGREIDAAATLACATRFGIRDSRIDAELARKPAAVVPIADRDEALAARVRRARAGAADAEDVRSLVAFLDSSNQLEVAGIVARLSDAPMPPFFERRLWRSTTPIADGEWRERRRVLFAKEIQDAKSIAPPLEALRSDWPVDAAHVRDAFERLRRSIRAWFAAEKLGVDSVEALRKVAIEATRAVIEGPARGRIFAENKVPMQNG
ncbi:MAG: glycosyltransferase family 39 protein [Planctomycetes bacterium]|nr:glycosyltransferase family 39 protein [Planctomycetota bacterium]MBI3846277.1 glycosyltransferase family 39 protein [Planctomycetota bacterium]